MNADEDSNINEDTWIHSKHILNAQIDDIVKLIIYGDGTKKNKLFNNNYIYHINDILKILKKDKILVYLALNKIIMNKIVINRNNKSGKHNMFINSQFVI